MEPAGVLGIQEAEGRSIKIILSRLPEGEFPKIEESRTCQVTTLAGFLIHFAINEGRYRYLLIVITFENVLHARLPGYQPTPV
jgi:hypothetical protein